MTDELLTVKEAAERYKLHVKTIRAWCRKGVVPYTRVGPYKRNIRILDSDLAATVSPGDE